jgi:hypothetical protein
MKTIPALLIAVIAVALVCGCVGQNAPTVPDVPTAPTTPDVSAGDNLTAQDLGGVADDETLGHGLEDEAVF